MDETSLWAVDWSVCIWRVGKLLAICRSCLIPEGADPLRLANIQMLNLHENKIQGEGIWNSKFINNLN
jgi:hypothetical protein